MMIQQAYNKWDRTPVIVTLSEVPTPVWDMDFPAITICPEIKVLNTKYNFTQDFEALQSQWYQGKGTTNRTITITDERWFFICISIPMEQKLIIPIDVASSALER